MCSEETKQNRSKKLFDRNLTTEEIKLKNAILEELKKENLLVLPNGTLEQYLPDGIEGDTKRNELNSIFEYIKQN